MKKNLIFMVLVLIFTSTFAQDLKSKKGETILPEANDWAISFSADPILNYIGNFFSGATGTNSAPVASWVNPNTMTIMGKQFKDEKTAYRLIVRVGYNLTSDKEQIPNAHVTTAPSYPNPPSMKEDVGKMSENFIEIGAGLEYRKGKTRLQGFYGCEALAWISSQKYSFTYGNTLSGTGTVVPVNGSTTTDFSSSDISYSNITVDSYGNTARVTKDKSGMLIGLGVCAFIGVEYFILPKISVGAEYDWGIGMGIQSSGSRTVESVGGTPQTVGTQTLKTNKGFSIGFDNVIDGFSGTGTGSLKVTFHF